MHSSQSVEPLVEGRLIPVQLLAGDLYPGPQRIVGRVSSPYVPRGLLWPEFHRQGSCSLCEGIIWLRKKRGTRFPPDPRLCQRILEDRHPGHGRHMYCLWLAVHSRIRQAAPKSRLEAQPAQTNEAKGGVANVDLTKRAAGRRLCLARSKTLNSTV